MPIDPADKKIYALAEIIRNTTRGNFSVVAIGPETYNRLYVKFTNVNRLLAWGHAGWVYFFTKTPVNSVDGLRKTKMFMWSGDDKMVSLWKTQGFQPVPLAATDIMTALQTGMINSYPTTPLLGLTLQWYRQTPNMVGMGLAPLVGGLVMTKAAWSKIAPADQKRIMASCAKLQHRLEIEVPRQDTTAVAEMQKRGEASPDDADALALTFAYPVQAALEEPARERYQTDSRNAEYGWMR